MVYSMDSSQSNVRSMHLFAPKKIEGFCIHWKNRTLSGPWIYIKHNIVSFTKLSEYNVFRPIDLYEM